MSDTQSVVSFDANPYLGLLRHQEPDLADPEPRLPVVVHAGANPVAVVFVQLQVLVHDDGEGDDDLRGLRGGGGVQVGDVAEVVDCSVSLSGG